MDWRGHIASSCFKSAARFDRLALIFGVFSLVFVLGEIRVGADYSPESAIRLFGFSTLVAMIAFLMGEVLIEHARLHQLLGVIFRGARFTAIFGLAIFLWAVMSPMETVSHVVLAVYMAGVVHQMFAPLIKCKQHFGFADSVLIDNSQSR